MAKKAEPKKAEPTSEILTFRDVRGWSLDNLVQREPGCWNGIVSVRQYRVTVQEVEESPEIIVERIQGVPPART